MSAQRRTATAIRFPAERHAALQALAARTELPMNYHVNLALQRYLDSLGGGVFPPPTHQHYWVGGRDDAVDDGATWRHCTGCGQHQLYYPTQRTFVPGGHVHRWRKADPSDQWACIDCTATSGAGLVR